MKNKLKKQLKKHKENLSFLHEYFHHESVGGVLLFIATLVALIWANSQWSSSYESFFSTHFIIGVGSYVLDKPLILWINDGLMAIFFFLVGMEIKRELVDGQLSSMRQATLPVFSAIGGMIFPALIFVLINNGTSGAQGWGIPVGTDIAFALGVLTLLGNRVSFSIKVFLTALAIVDDVGGILIIAFFYSAYINFKMLSLALGIFLFLLLMNRLGVRKVSFYLILGVGLWVAFLKSGVHATIAGVLLATAIPSKADIRVEPPMQRLERHLHPWVTYFIMPVFALANAGVVFNLSPGELVTHPVSLGVFFGLVLGKQLGITLFTWLSIRLKVAQLPEGVSFKEIYGVSWLGGIGFTMSLFIAGLAFGDSVHLPVAKVSILVASVFSGVVGFIFLWNQKRVD